MKKSLFVSTLTSVAVLLAMGSLNACTSSKSDKSALDVAKESDNSASFENLVPGPNLLKSKYAVFKPGETSPSMKNCIPFGVGKWGTVEIDFNGVAQGITFTSRFFRDDKCSIAVPDQWHRWDGQYQFVEEIDSADVIAEIRWTNGTRSYADFTYSTEGSIGKLVAFQQGETLAQVETGTQGRMYVQLIDGNTPSPQPTNSIPTKPVVAQVASTIQDARTILCNNQGYGTRFDLPQNGFAIPGTGPITTKPFNCRQTAPDSTLDLPSDLNYSTSQQNGWLIVSLNSGGQEWGSLSSGGINNGLSTGLAASSTLDGDSGQCIFMTAGSIDVLPAALHCGGEN